jgi:hypothetical protein
VVIWNELEISGISPEFKNQNPKALAWTKKKHELSKLFLPSTLSIKCKLLKFLVFHAKNLAGQYIFKIEHIFPYTHRQI